MAALRNPDAEVRYLAAQQLAGEGATDTIPQLVKALRAEKVPRTKVNIAYAIAQMGEEKGFAALKNLCDDAQAPGYRRMIAAGYMLELGNESCLSTVISLAEADPDDRVQAFDLLPRFKNVSQDDSSKIFTVIRASLTDPNSSRGLRMAASYAFGRLGDVSAIPYLESAIATEKR